MSAESWLSRQVINTDNAYNLNQLAFLMEVSFLMEVKLIIKTQL